MNEKATEKELNKGFFTPKKLIILAAAVAVVAVIVALIISCARSRAVSESVREGVDYIKSMENADVAAVDGRVNAVRQKIFFDELDVKLEEDPDYVWTALDQIGTVIFGDSRMVPFASYGFMDESRVLADGGENLYSMDKHMDELKAAAPNLIVIGYGLNDIGWPHSTPEEYCEAIMGYVDQMQEMLPDAHIYIQSILIPRDRMEEWYDMPGLAAKAREWDPIEQEYFREHGYNVIDVSDLVEEHEDTFGDDGAHFYPAFYPYLAERYLKTYLQDTMVFDD